MAVLPEKEEDIDWNVDMEVQLFHAMRGHKPVGVNRYFQMALIHEKFSNSINREISSKQIWSHLDTMYDMAALHDSEILPFPNDQVDFMLPSSEFSDLISKKLDELPLSQAVTQKANKNESSPSKTNNVPAAKTPKAAPVKVNQSHSSQAPNKITKDLMGAKLSVPLTPISTKINKSDIAMKTETKQAPRDPIVTPKNKSDNTPIVKVSKSLTPSSLPVGKSVKLESPVGSQKNPKSDSSSEGSNKKGNKQDSSSNFKKHKTEIIENVSQKKIKQESDCNFKRSKSESITELTNKKNNKPENSNGTKKQKGDGDGFKKQKGESDWTKKLKSDGDGTKKSPDSSGTKSSKYESKTYMSAPSKGSKGEEDSSSSTVASTKTPKMHGKGEGSDNLNKRKRQKNDDSQRKPGTPGSTPAAKRRRN